MGRSWKDFEVQDRESLGCLKPNFSRTINVKGSFGEDPEGNEESVTRQWERDDLCHIVVEKLADLCPTVVCKAEFVSNEAGYLAKEISK